jgi:hypothetical protein
MRRGDSSPKIMPPISHIAHRSLILPPTSLARFGAPSAAASSGSSQSNLHSVG